MRTFFLVGALMTSVVVFALLGQSSGPQRPGAPSTIDSASAESALLTRYCVTCHSQKAKAAGLDAAQRITLDSLDPAHVEKNPEQWEKVVRKLRAGMMPPSGMPRPDQHTMESMIQWLEGELDRSAVAQLPAPGLHRMNRVEYANAIRDLLALEIDTTKYLPSDDSTRGFDNIAGALSLSPALLESYVAAAAKISRMALGNVKAPSETVYAFRKMPRRSTTSRACLSARAAA